MVTFQFLKFLGEERDCKTVKKLSRGEICVPHIIPPDYDASQGSLSVALFKYIKMVLRPILSQSQSVFTNEEAKTGPY